MFEEINQAIQAEDYTTAIQLVKKLRQDEPDNLWGLFYTARLYEARGKLKEAKQAYTQLLKKATYPKLMRQIRQGIERIDHNVTTQKVQVIAQQKAQPGGEDLGVFVLETISSEEKTHAAQQFGKIMGMDPYTARLQLPSRSWRLYRSGKMGELLYHVNQLRQVGVPCFCLPIRRVQKLCVYQVKSFEAVSPQVTLTCEQQEGETETLTFGWEEVSKRVEGLVPIFEQSLQFGVKNKMYRKTKILDYAHFCDLYLPQRQTILRICDRQYHFQEGINIFAEAEQTLSNQEATIRLRWNQLLKVIQNYLPEVPLWSEFTFFGETAVDFPDLLQNIESHIHLLRREATPWDPAFHLYSSLVFLKP